MEQPGDTDRHGRLPTIVVGAVLILLVGWLARVPTGAPGEPGPTATQGSSPPTEAATAGPRPTDDPSRYSIRPLDPVTLRPRRDTPLGSLPRSIEVVAATGGDAVIVAIDDDRAAALSVVAHRLRPLADREEWTQTPVDPFPGRTWIGADDESLAWVTSDGSIRLSRQGTEPVPALRLPDERRVVEGRFVTRDQIGFLLQESDPQPPTVQAVLSYLLMDVATGAVVVDVPIPATEDGLRLAKGVAWDIPADRLYVQRSLSSSLTAVALSSGAILEVDVPIDWPVFGLRAGGRRLVVFPLGDRRLDERVPDEAMLLDADLNLLGHRTDIGLVQVAVNTGGRIVGRDAQQHILLLDDTFATSTVMTGLGDDVDLLGISPDVFYAVTRSDAPDEHQHLTSYDLAYGAVRGRRNIAETAIFLPDGAVLLS